MKLSAKEIEIMDVLWTHDVPMTVNEIIAASPENRSWSLKSINSMLPKLLAKGAVGVSHLSKTATMPARAYIPNLTYEQYMARNVAVVYKDGKIDIQAFIEALLEAVKRTEDGA